MTTPQASPSGDSGFKLARGTVFPLVGGRSTWKQEHLLPILVTIAVALSLMVVFSPGATGAGRTAEAWKVYAIISGYIAFMVTYYINTMCDRPKRLWALGAVAFVTAELLGSSVWQHWYQFFYTTIPGTELEKSTSPAAVFAGFFVATGLCEESFKAIPLLLLALVGGVLAFFTRHSKGRFGRLCAFLNRQVGLRDPRDGIVLGVASGCGFFITETLFEYVPNTMTTAKYAGAQAFDGLVVLLMRGLPTMVEHSAWAGLFGYFIGLSVLRPGRAFLLLPLGLFSAAALHGAWDGFAEAFPNNGLVVLGAWLVIGLFSYALLAGAIFKAREISPAASAPAAAPSDMDDSG